MKNKELLLEISYKYNLNCMHCSSIKCEGKIKVSELPYYLYDSENQKNLLDEIETVRISGGEPTLLDNLNDYVNFFYDRDIKVILQTNGISNYTDYFKLKNVDEFWISLFGERCIHDFIVQKTGSYQKTISNILKIRDTILSKVVIQTPVFNYPQLCSFGRIPNDIGNKYNLRLFALLNQGRCNFALPIEQQIKISQKFYNSYKDYVNIDLTCSLDDTKCNYENKLVLKPDGSLFNCASHKHGRTLCKK